jgi:citrate lyase beta subunit
VIDSYHFIKYDKNTSPEFVLRRNESDATLCFDFEDSIQNWILPQKNSELKAEYRNYFRKLFTGNSSQLQNCKIGIRLNSESSGEQIFDVRTLQSVKDFLKIHSILLPKTEDCEQVIRLIENLDKLKILYDEIIPIIESKNGLNNLPDIAKLYPQKIRNIGFGHCDYNLDIGAFPFFHQESIEYWRWIHKLFSILDINHIRIINSAYLQLENHSYFQKMLGYMKSICGDNFAQFTLTFRQSIQCRDFIEHGNIEYKKINERLNLRPVRSNAESLIDKFETEDHHIGFAVTRENRILISPQEYVSAKNFIYSLTEKNIELAFLGGCFPVQYNILFEDNFLQLMRTKINKEYNANLIINIIRYERLTSFMEKLQNYRENNPLDILVFHIRAEPYLRILKFYYRYLNNDGENKWSVNFPFLKFISSEKYDYYLLGRRYSNIVQNKVSVLHKFMINLNYLSGSLIGNHIYAMKQYLKLTDDLVKYCIENKIKLILLGPTLRSSTILERLFSLRMVKMTERYFKNKKVNFVSGIDTTSEDQKEYFNLNGIHANEKYHEIISQRILSEISQII